MAVLKIAPWHWLPRQNWRVVGEVNEADEVPRRLPRRGAMFVGSRSVPKWLVFDCPCRSGHRIMVNLNSARHPVWKLIARSPLTATPSFDATNYGRRCHFLITSGRVEWVTDRS